MLFLCSSSICAVVRSGVCVIISVVVCCLVIFIANKVVCDVGDAVRNIIYNIAYCIAGVIKNGITVLVRLASIGSAVCVSVACVVIVGASAVCCIVACKVAASVICCCIVACG